MPARPRHALLPTSLSRLLARSHLAIGLCFILVVTVALLLLAPGSRRRSAASPGAARLRMQQQVARRFAGIPQHDAGLGRPNAPITMQVFVDLEDHGDGTRWFDEMLPPILEKFVKTNIVRLEFRSFKTDTLNPIPLMMQQTSALAAGSQDLLWNYAATFVNEQGTEFTNYVTEKFLRGIAKQIPGLDLAEWERSRTGAMERIVVADDSAAREAGFYDTPAFRIGRTGGKMRNFSGSIVEDYHKYIVRTKPSGERYSGRKLTMATSGLIGRCSGREEGRKGTDLRRGRCFQQQMSPGAQRAPAPPPDAAKRLSLGPIISPDQIK